MKLLFVNRYFYPDLSATSQMLSALAFALARQGHRVEIVTSRQRYDDPGRSLARSQQINGVLVHRVWTTRFGRHRLPGRVLDYLTFYLLAAWTLWARTRRGDIVVTKTDPPIMSVVSSPIAWLRGGRRVNWLQDLFPEVAEAMSLGGPKLAVVYRVLRWARNRTLRQADCNVVLGELMARRLARIGVEADRVRVIPNWADGDLIRPIEPRRNPLRAAWGLADAFVVGYSGNLGRAHDLDTMLAAMRALSSAREQAAGRTIAWLFIGGGQMMQRLAREARAGGLGRVIFQPYQEQERLAESLSAADLHLISLRPELEGAIVPSKVYGIMAAGRPCLFIGAPDGEIARMITGNEIGRVIRQGDGAGLADAISSLAADAPTVARMGQRARRAFEAELDLAHAVARWSDLVGQLSGEPRAATDQGNDAQRGDAGGMIERVRPSNQ